MKYIPRNKTNRKRKFADSEFLGLYNSGMSDNKIAQKFKCSRESVRSRRMKIIDYDGKEVNWYIADIVHYNEEWLRWIIVDLHSKLEDALKKEESE